MTWIPKFLSPMSALIAAAVALPLLLLLYFLKLRRREMTVSSTLLWKKAIQDLQVNAPFQRLRRNLLLMLQMLLLLCLIGALARPVANYSPGPGKLSIILIDRSASMSATDVEHGTRLDEAKRRAKNLVAGLDKHAQAMVIAFDDTPQIMQTLTSDQQALRAAIDRIEGTDRSTRLKMAYQLADAQAAYIAEENRSNVKPDVYLFSDGRALDNNELRLQGELHFEPIGSESVGNIAIVAFSAMRNYERPTDVQVFARLANFGPAPVSADVQLSIDGRVSTVRAANLAPERWSDPQWVSAHPGEKDEKFQAQDSVEFSIDLPRAATLKIEQMHKDGDALAADDAAQVVVPPPRPLAVALVTEGNYYLERLISRMSLEDPAILTPAQYEQLSPEQVRKKDVVIFDHYQPAALPEAGGFIYFDSVPPGTKLTSEMDQGKMVTIAGLSGVLDWKRDDPILRGLNLNKLYVSDPIKLLVPPEAEVLVAGVKTPLVVLYREGTRTHIVAAFDLLTSTWPLQASFPAFMYNSMQYLALGSEMNLRQSLSPGATPRIPRANLDKVAPGATQIRLEGPTGSRVVPVAAKGDVVLPALDRVGLYSTVPPIPGYETIAVNLLDDNESNLVPLPAQVPPGHVGTALGGGGKARLELWWWLVACGALPLLFVEWWVYTRRVHL